MGTMAEGLPRVNLCLLGFGSANREFARTLLAKQVELSFAPVITGIVTGSSGRMVAGDGIDMTAALQVNKIHELSGAEPGKATQESIIAMLLQMRSESILDIVIEAIPADHTSGQPGLGISKAALKAGISVVTTNKAAVARALSELQECAAENRCQYLYEAACMGGVPLFNLARHCLPHMRILSFEGVLNVTCNVIIQKLEEGVEFAEAVMAARDMSFVEWNPNDDISGREAAMKCVCLARALGIAPDATLQDVSPVEGVRGLDPRGVKDQLPNRFKIVCRGARHEDGTVSMSVTREIVPPGSPLHGITGPALSISLRTDVFPQGITLIDQAPSRTSVAYGLFADCREACMQVVDRRRSQRT